LVITSVPDNCTGLGVRGIIARNNRWIAERRLAEADKQDQARVETAGERMFPN